MEQAWVKYKHWLIAAGVATVGITVMVFAQNQPQKSKTDSAVASQQISSINVAEYKNTGAEAKDDNFFLSGTFQHLSDLRDNTKPTVVWISASWCETCHYMRSFVWKTANKYKDKIVVKEIDFSDNYDTIVLPNYYFGTPTFVVLNTKGEAVTIFYGADEKGFDEQLAKASLTK